MAGRTRCWPCAAARQPACSGNTLLSEHQAQRGQGLSPCQSSSGHQRIPGVVPLVERVGVDPVSAGQSTEYRIPVVCGATYVRVLGSTSRVHGARVGKAKEQERDSEHVVSMNRQPRITRQRRKTASSGGQAEYNTLYTDPVCGCVCVGKGRGAHSLGWSVADSDSNDCSTEHPVSVFIYIARHGRPNGVARLNPPRRVAGWE